MVFFLLSFLLLLHPTNGQDTQWYDTFQKTLCRERWAQMDWQSMLRPCRFNLQFGQNKYEKRDRTSPKWSHTLGLHFKKTGEFSRLGIQSRTEDGHNKNMGGDTWRVFIRGADKITPFVADLNNGVYEAKFIALNPGFYKAEILLQSTLCEAFKDPPQDWLKRDAATIIDDEKNSKLLWAPLRGGNISFKIEDSTDEVKEGLRRSFRRWKDSCGLQYNCNLLWKGFGHWTNSTWMPYIEERQVPEIEERCFKKQEGVLKLTGDDLNKDIYNNLKNSTLCNGGVFTKCISEEPGEQPDTKMLMNRGKNGTKFSTKIYLNALKNLLKKDEMDEKSGLLLNYGHGFVQNMPFKRFRMFIDRAVKILKEKYEGKAVWRTMASRWKDSSDPNYHFQNHQRIQLFNAYATSAMCNAGIPVLDIFQMTESAPSHSHSSVLNTIGNILTDYFQRNPTKSCEINTSNPVAENVTSGDTESSVANLVGSSFIPNEGYPISQEASYSQEAAFNTIPSTNDATEIQEMQNANEFSNSYMGVNTPQIYGETSKIRNTKTEQLKYEAEFDYPVQRKRNIASE